MTDATGRGSFDQLITELRPKLHRYCARMTGSVVDGEDVLQEALIKAIEALSDGRADWSIPRAGSSVLPTMLRSTSCVVGRGRNQCAPTRTRT